MPSHLSDQIERLITISNQLNLSSSQRFMLVVILLLSRGRNEVAASYAELATHYGAKPRNVMRIVARLKEAGAIAVSARADAEAGTMRNTYSVPLLNDGDDL